MVDIKSVQKQLKGIKFGGSLWNQAEIRELPNILHEGEKVAECANGVYEGGLALMVATDQRVLLIDKKPLNYLTVEDLRFDMINEIDYSHRLMGAAVTISSGSKTMKFKSYNQARLRRLINLVQQRMSEVKQEQAEKTENQQQHLEEINKQLQMYLLAQHQQLQQQISEDTSGVPKPSPQLSDYLFAQRLLEQFQQQDAQKSAIAAPAVDAPSLNPEKTTPADPVELRAAARREVFGKAALQKTESTAEQIPSTGRPLEINALKVAYSKLPMMLRNRKFGRPSFQAGSPQNATNRTQTAA